MNARNLLRGFDDGERGRRDPEVADHPLRHPLVEGEREQQRIGKRIGNIIGVKERRDLGFAAETSEALGNVEDEVPPFARDKPLRQCTDVADPVGLVTEVTQCSFDRRDRLRVIEFRCLFLSISFGEVIVPKVVCYADFHVIALDSNGSIDKGGLLPALGEEARGAGSQCMTFSIEGQSGYRKIFPS